MAKRSFCLLYLGIFAATYLGFTTSVPTVSFVVNDVILCNHTQESVDGFVDEVLDAIRFFVMDYMPLPPIPVGKIKLKNGHVEGLSTLQRMSPMSIMCDNETSSIIIDGKIGFQSLLISYNYSNKMMPDLSGRINMQYQDIRAYAKIVYISSTRKKYLQIEELRIEKLNDLHITYDGPYSWFLQFQGQNIALLVANHVNDVIENKVLKNVNQILNTTIKFAI